MARFAEAEPAVELMGVPREEDPAPEALEVGMRLDGRHELLAHAAAPMGIEHEDIADIGEGGVVRDHAGKAHLLVSIEGAETGGVAEGAGHQLARNPRGPVRGPREETMDHVEVEPRRVGDDRQLGWAAFVEHGIVLLVGRRAQACARRVWRMADSGTRSRRSTLRAAAGLGVAMKTVSSPASVPTSPRSLRSRDRVGWATVKPRRRRSCWSSSCERTACSRTSSRIAARRRRTRLIEFIFMIEHKYSPRTAGLSSPMCGYDLVRRAGQILVAADGPEQRSDGRIRRFAEPACPSARSRRPCTRADRGRRESGPSA